MKIFSFLAVISTIAALKTGARKSSVVMKSDSKWSPKALIPAALGTLFFLNSPEPSAALSSGGRSGGSSFRAPSSSRMNSYSRSYSGSTDYSRSSRSISPSISISPIMPISPFGYSPFGFSPFGFSPFGFMPINLNFIIMAGLAYAVYTALSNRVGGSDFSDNFNGSLGSGASVVKLTLGLDADWNDNRNIMNQLTTIASKYSAMTDRTDLSRLLSETSLALLRSKNDWNAVAYSGDKFGSNNFGKAETTFQQIAIKERAKFDEETNGNTGNIMIRPSSNSDRFDGSKPTQAVVSIIVAVRGQSEAVLRNVKSNNDVAQVLERLAADALTDEGENIMAVEVLWSPSSPSEVLSERDLIMDYPELMKL